MKDVADEAGQAVALPRPGEPFEPAGKLPSDTWWRAVAAPAAQPWRRSGVAEAPPVHQEEVDLAGER